MRIAHARTLTNGMHALLRTKSQRIRWHCRNMQSGQEETMERNLCDKCYSCEDRDRFSLTDCFMECGYPVDLLSDIEAKRRENDQRRDQKDHHGNDCCLS